MPKLSNLEIEVMEEEGDERYSVNEPHKKKKVKRKDGVRRKLDEYFEARRMKQELNFYD